ncbi:MAG: hypothetical protein ABR987_22345, partial [Terracidiphilus sp.]
MRSRFIGRLAIPSPLRAWILRAVREALGVLAVCVAVAWLPGIAAALDTAAPTQPSLVFAPAPVGVAPAQAQLITAEFI